MKLYQRCFKVVIERKLILFLLITLWLSLEYIALGPYSYIRIHDTGDSFVTRYIVFAEDFFKHGITYWFPYMGSGVDRLANDLLYPQFAVILFGIFPGWFAYQIIIVTQFFLAGYFTYRLCKDHLKLSEVLSVLAGIVFALNCNDLINFQLGYAGFPFILWSIEKIVDSNNKYRYLWIALLGISYSFCSSFAWTLPFTLSTALLWFIFRSRLNLNFIILFSIFSLFVLLSQHSAIYSLLLNSHTSHRADWGLQATSEGPIDSLVYLRVFLSGVKRLLSPMTIIFTFIGLVVSRFRSRPLIYLFLLFAFCTLGASLINLSKMFFKDHISFLAGFQFDRYYELAPLFGALTSAWSLELIRERLNNWWIAKINNSDPAMYGVFTMLIVIIFTWQFYQSMRVKIDHVQTWVSEGNYIANYQNENLKRIVENEDEPFRVATVNMRLHPAYANAYGIETVDGYINLYSKSYQHYWSKVIEPLTGKHKPLYYYFNYWGNRVYLFSPIDTTDGIIFDDFYRFKLLSLANVKYIISTVPLKNDNLLVLSEPESGESTDKQKKIKIFMKRIMENFKGKSLYIYKNREYLPRFFFARKVIVFDTSRDMLAEMSATDFTSLSNTVYMESKYFKENYKNIDSTLNASIKLEKYSPDRIALSIKLDASGFLIVSNAYSPYWKCKVNGIDKHIFPAYGTFWGILLDKSAERVEFIYAPPYRMISYDLNNLGPESRSS